MFCFVFIFFNEKWLVAEFRVREVENVVLRFDFFSDFVAVVGVRELYREVVY